ncbi:MAG: hypothetical protein HKN51_09960 [Saprospiraceae bacterium]|nr:hypothetical protein [Saprospiraceae bacterium]NNL31976.1 hypothetical protein [Flavobacteriaceae bacterium]
MKITRRDIKFFIFGFLAMLLVLIIYEWSDFKKGFNEGYNDHRSTIEVKK